MTKKILHEERSELSLKTVCRVNKKGCTKAYDKKEGLEGAASATLSYIGLLHAPGNYGGSAAKPSFSGKARGPLHTSFMQFSLFRFRERSRNFYPGKSARDLAVPTVSSEVAATLSKLM